MHINTVAGSRWQTIAISDLEVYQCLLSKAEMLRLRGFPFRFSLNPDEYNVDWKKVKTVEWWTDYEKNIHYVRWELK